MDKELEDIKRLAGIVKEQDYGLGSSEMFMDKAKRLIAVTDQAITTGNTGQARANLRELLGLIQTHKDEEGQRNFKRGPTSTDKAEPGAQQIPAMGQ